MSQPKDPTAAERQKRRREAVKQQGLTLVRELVPESKAAELREIARRMRDEHSAAKPA